MPDAEKITYVDIQKVRERLSTHILESIKALSHVLYFPPHIANIALHVLFTYPYAEMSRIADPKGFDVDAWYSEAEYIFSVGLWRFSDLTEADIEYYTLQFCNIIRLQTAETIEIAKSILG